MTNQPSDFLSPSFLANTDYKKVHEDKDWMIIQSVYGLLEIIHFHQPTDSFVTHDYCPKCKEKVPEHLLATILIGNLHAPDF